MTSKTEAESFWEVCHFIAVGLIYDDDLAVQRMCILRRHARVWMDEAIYCRVSIAHHVKIDRIVIIGVIYYL